MVLSEGRKDLHISCFPVCHPIIPVWMAKRSLESETSRVSYLKNSDGLPQGTKPRPRNQFQLTCFSLSLLYSYYFTLLYLHQGTRYYLALRPFLLAFTTLHGPYCVVVELPEAQGLCATFTFISKGIAINIHDSRVVPLKFFRFVSIGF